MLTTRFPRLEGFLGKPLSLTTWDDFAKVANGGLREDETLEFKREHYGNADRDKEELAADVAAMANSRGGLIVLGIAEAEGDRDSAGPITAVELSGKEEQRIRSIVHDTISPVPLFDFHRVEDPARQGQGILVIAVPRSANAPHAVRKNQSLRYVARHGGGKRPLSESEVADAYRSRFRDASDQVQRLGAVYEAGLDQLRASSPGLWYTLALVPTTSAEMTIRQTTLDNFRKWADRYKDFDGPVGRGFLEVGTLHRRVTVTHHRRSQRGANRFWAEFHTDGAAFIGFQQLSLEEPDGPTGIHHVGLVLAMFRLFRMARDHAVEHAGSVGDALVSAGVENFEGGQVQLVHAEGNAPFDDRFLYPGHPLVRIPYSRHTVSLDAGAAQQLLATARQLSADFFQAFGHPEPRAVAEDGAVISSEWRLDPSDRAWLDRHGVEIR